MSTSPVTAVAETTLELCTFTVAGRRFGVPIGDVREITAGADIEPVPHAPEAVAGYVNIRGHIHLLLDLRRLMGYAVADRSADEERRMVVFKDHCGPSYGVLIDRVGDIIKVEESGIVDRRAGDADSKPTSGERRAAPSGLVRGVIAVESGLILVLRATALIESLE